MKNESIMIPAASRNGAPGAYTLAPVSENAAKVWVISNGARIVASETMLARTP